MADTLKDNAATAKLVAQEALEKALTELKSYIDTQDAAGSGASSDAIAAVNARIDTLIGVDDATQAIDTFNEIKAFLAGIQDTTLQQLLNAVSTAIKTEETRATAAESALSGRVTTLENVSIMTESEAKTIFDSVFNPIQP